MMTINYEFVAVRRIGTLLLNNVENSAEGFRCGAFQNTAGARIEADRPTYRNAEILLNGLLEG